jgi:hypothetical protein
MRQFALALAITTIVALNVVIWQGVLGRDGTIWFERSLLAANVAMPVSSLLLAAMLVRLRHWIPAVLCIGNVALMAGVIAFHAGGVVAPRSFLFALDLYLVQLYVLIVARYGLEILRLRTPGNSAEHEAAAVT